MLPPPVPARLSWNVPLESFWCKPPISDGEGNLAIWTDAPVSGKEAESILFFGANGLHSDLASQGTLRALFPRSSGFWALDNACGPNYTNRQLASDGQLVRESPGEILHRVPNPLGGYVEMRAAEQYRAIQLRWVDEDLRPSGEWHTVASWPGGNRDERVVVDRRGRALVLTFHYPASFGPPPPPLEWTFSARWMGPDGVPGEAFEPVVPVRTAGGTVIWPASWDGSVFVPLPDGGFAVFHEPASLNPAEQVSPSGWYASYIEGQPPIPSVVPWVQQYGGSLQLIGGGPNYAAMREDPVTCQRTALLIARTGRLCSTLPLEGSEVCGGHDLLLPDGTYALTDYATTCAVRWWPGLARLPLF